MEPSTPIYLTLVQKIRLAASVFVIYWPIRLYVNIDQVGQYADYDQLGWAFFRYSVLLWLLEIPLTILFFTFWLSVTEWLEKLFFRKSRPDFLVDFGWRARFTTFLVAGGLAVVFNVVFHRIVIAQLTYFIGKDEPKVITKLGAPVRPGAKIDDVTRRMRMEGNRRYKANNGLTIIAMLMAFYLAANRRGYKALAELRVNAEQLKLEATQAQFVALKNQVNPHFLFNSLSILSSLVEVDPKLSVRFINHLSKSYRYILEQRDSERVNLKTELDFIAAYSFLLNIRFDGKLQIRNDVAPAEAMRYSIAPLTLQLLVENAVKHNQMSTENPLTVAIYIEGDELVVSNPLQLRSQSEPSTGLGLENITNRYQLLTERPLWIGEQDQSFVVKIPLLT